MNRDLYVTTVLYVARGCTGSQCSWFRMVWCYRASWPVFPVTNSADYSLSWTPRHDWFFRQGGQTTQLHCSVIGFESRSGSSSGCVCCHTVVFTEQLHHTSPRVCVDVLILRVVIVFVRLSQTHWLSRWRTGRHSATVRSQWLRHGPGMVRLRRSELQRLCTHSVGN